MFQKLKTYIPGVAVAITSAALAYFLAQIIPMAGSVLLALLIGMVLGNTFVNGQTCAPGLKFVEKQVLEWAIVLTGFGLSLTELQGMGNTLIGLVLVAVFGVLVLAWGLGRLFKSSSRFSFLIGAGSAICGSSAIAATSPIVEASEEETGLALGIVNVLGLLGMVLFPVLATSLGFTEEQSGVFLGLTLPALGNVVGAGYALGDNVGDLATLTKLARIAMMVPLLLAVYFLKSNKGNTKFPWFILGFVAAVAIAHFNLLPAAIEGHFATAGKWLIVVAMAAVGVKIKFAPLLKLSKKGIGQGMVLFVLQTVLGLALVWLFI